MLVANLGSECFIASAIMNAIIHSTNGQKFRIVFRLMDVDRFDAVIPREITGTSPLRIS